MEFFKFALLLEVVSLQNIPYNRQISFINIDTSNQTKVYPPQINNSQISSFSQGSVFSSTQPATYPSVQQIPSPYSLPEANSSTQPPTYPSVQQIPSSSAQPTSSLQSLPVSNSINFASRPLTQSTTNTQSSNLELLNSIVRAARPSTTNQQQFGLSPEQILFYQKQAQTPQMLPNVPIIRKDDEKLNAQLAELVAVLKNGGPIVPSIPQSSSVPNGNNQNNLPNIPGVPSFPYVSNTSNTPNSNPQTTNQPSQSTIPSFPQLTPTLPPQQNSNPSPTTQNPTFNSFQQNPNSNPSQQNSNLSPTVQNQMPPPSQQVSTSPQSTDPSQAQQNSPETSSEGRASAAFGLPNPYTSNGYTDPAQQAPSSKNSSPSRVPSDPFNLFSFG